MFNVDGDVVTIIICVTGFMAGLGVSSEPFPPCPCLHLLTRGTLIKLYY